MDKIQLIQIDEKDAELTCLFSKKTFKPVKGLAGTFRGAFVSLDETLKRGFELSPDFKRPAVATRAELSSWLTAHGIDRVNHFEQYTKLYRELGAELDPGHQR